MIEVKWDFEGPDLGRAAQAEVELVVRRLQRTLGAAVCFEHGLHPVVRISGKNMGYHGNLPPVLLPRADEREHWPNPGSATEAPEEPGVDEAALRQRTAPGPI